MIVVPDLRFVVRERVVLVDDRKDAPRQELLKRVPGAQKTSPVLDVVLHHEKLRDHGVAFLEHAREHRHELILPHRRRRLPLYDRHRGPILSHAEVPCRDGARHDHHDLEALVTQCGDVLGDTLDDERIETSSGRDDAAPDLDHDPAELAEVTARALPARARPVRARFGAHAAPPSSNSSAALRAERTKPLIIAELKP